MKTLIFNGDTYPFFQSEGFAAQFAIPFAKHICKGEGYDIGCAKKEWSLPGSTPIDLLFEDSWDAMKLPDKLVDYIFSSHCLEHLNDWVRVLDYWTSKIKSGGHIFLYLPHKDQKYWRPWNNTKHMHMFTPEDLLFYFQDGPYKNIFYSHRDLNHSFMITAEKV